MKRVVVGLVAALACAPGCGSKHEKEPPAPAAHPDWKRVAGAGIALYLPAGFAAQALDPKSITPASGPMLMATIGAVKTPEQMVFVFHEDDRTGFATVQECAKAVTKVATDLKGVLRLATTDNGTCAGSIGTRETDVRLRYWSEGGKKYSILCEAQVGKAEVSALCDDIWASHELE